MSLPYYLDENNNKVFYTSDNKINLHTTYYDNEDNTRTELEFDTFEDELSYYGFSSSQISSIKEKLTKVNDASYNTNVSVTDPITNQTISKPNGTLVSNSALALKNTTEFQKALIEIEKSKIQIMNVQNEIQNKQLQQMDYNLIMQTQLYSEYLEMNKNIKAQTEAIKKLKLTADIGNVIQDVTVDTTALAEANQKIAEGVESQKAVNEKMLEHYNYLKDGSTNVKDSAGNVIKPREVEAKNNAEHHIYKQSQNTFNHAENFQKVLEQLEPILNGNSSNNGTGGSGSNTSNDCNYSDDETGLLKLLCTLKTFDLKKFETDSNLNLFSKGVNNG